MPSNKETLFQAHIASFLEREHGYHLLRTDELGDTKHHLIESELITFITSTQPDAYRQIETNYHSDTNREIIKALHEELERTPLWLVMRNGLDVKGTRLELYKPKPRSNTTPEQERLYKLNRYAVKPEYRYNPRSDERVDLVVWLNGLPIIVVELKHEDEGQTCEDAIHDSFLTRDLNSTLYRYPFLYVAASNTEVKVATNPGQPGNFCWFNAALTNLAETEGEYPVEHLYRHALSPDNIALYLERYLVYVPAKDESTSTGVRLVSPARTLFPRYHQLRASKGVGDAVLDHVKTTGALGDRYLINHSAGSGKTFTIAWMADVLDGLYEANNRKVYDNIIILTDRRSLDKNIKDDLALFAHLEPKLNFAKRSGDLARFLDADRDIIVTTLQKFNHIQEKLKSSEILKQRRVAFLIDEGHRSQEGKMALTLRKFFTMDGTEGEQEEDERTGTEELGDELEGLNTSNQTFVAFTATTTAKTVATFGEPFDTYTEEEAITEGFIVDVAQHIISYETLYHLGVRAAMPDKTFGTGTVSQLLKRLAFNDDELIQYKCEVIIQLFEKHVRNALDGKAKAMVVASSRPAGLKYLKYLQAIIEEKELPYKVLFAFSDYTDPVTNESIEEEIVNGLHTQHGGKLIEEVFEQDDHRIMVVANKFQTGFDEPLLSAMFLDKVVSGVNAVQTVSRLNRKHPDKTQADILVVDFTNNADGIFDAFNKHRKGSPYKECKSDPDVLDELYAAIAGTGAFNSVEVDQYIAEYIEAEKQARLRMSKADALLSNTNQRYRDLFKERIPDVDHQRAYIGMLNRYTKLYYFIAQFYPLEQHLHNFIVFAEAMSNALIKRGRTSELKQLMKYVELTKGAVRYEGIKANSQKAADPKPTGSRTIGIGAEPPRITIDQALKGIQERFPISDDEALVIREICTEVSTDYEIRERLIANKDNEDYLKQTARPRVRQEITGAYLRRGLWEKLEDPIYVERGGIISLMGRTVIDMVLHARP